MDTIDSYYLSNNKNSFAVFLIGTTFFLSILAQIYNPTLYAIARPLMYASWIASGFYLFLKLRFTINVRSYGFIMLFAYALFRCYSLIVTLFGVDHLHSGITPPFTISLGVYFVGVLLTQINFTQENLKKCLIIFVVSVALLALQIRMTYFSSLSSWMDSMTYGYQKKNSAGQLFVLASIILLFYFNNKNKMYTLIRLVTTGLLLYVLLLIQCRTAFFAFIVACLARLLFKKKGRVVFLLCILITALFALNNDSIMSIIEKALFIQKYSGTDLNTFSSGRLGLWQQAILNLNQHPFVGTGIYYVDNFYLNVLTENGLIGALIIFCILAIRIVFNLRMKHDNQSSIEENNLKLVVKLFCVFYLIESCFEGLPPFGPGVCAFMFWFLSGYLDMRIKNK